MRTKAADGFVEALLYEGVTDPGRRQTLRESKAYCYEHAWSLERTGASLGTAIIAHDLFRHAVAAVDSARFGPGSGGWLRRLLGRLRSRASVNSSARARIRSSERLVVALGPERACPACVWSDKMEGLYLEDLNKYLVREDGLLAEFEASDGLCLPHFRRALGLVQDKKTFIALSQAQLVVWERLIDDLGEFMRKSDHRFRHERMSTREGDAWLRAISSLVGARPGREK